MGFVHILACGDPTARSIVLPKVRPAHATMFALFALVREGTAVAFDRVPQPGDHAVRLGVDRW
jgi:hypothetical protein